MGYFVEAFDTVGGAMKNARCALLRCQQLKNSNRSPSSSAKGKQVMEEIYEELKLQKSFKYRNAV